MESLGELARSFFGVTLPVSSVELKKAYRRRCLDLHPDRGGDVVEFKAMQQAYEALTSSGCVAETFASEEEFKGEALTRDGTPLSSLGLGLGAAQNGRDCPRCQHKGYYTFIEHDFNLVDCPDCRGSGFVEKFYKCQPCQGTGKFKQAHGKVVPCRVCNGTGKAKESLKDLEMNFFRGFSRHTRCSKCQGLGSVRNVTPRRKVYVRCEECSGTGEIPIWNPVLRKSALSHPGRK